MDRASSGRSLGDAGELAALAHYRSAGYRLVAQNWRCGLGELDLVVLRDRTLVFCEVKTRRAGGLGGPFDAVNWRKQAKLRSLAEVFLASMSLPYDDIRFDVASVTAGETGLPSIHVFEAAF